jgi:hypothetical protein
MVLLKYQYKVLKGNEFNFLKPYNPKSQHYIKILGLIPKGPNRNLICVEKNSQNSPLSKATHSMLVGFINRQTKKASHTAFPSNVRRRPKV